MDFTPTAYEIHTKIPEEMSVGKLNAVVRALREALYQERIRSVSSRNYSRGFERASTAAITEIENDLA